MSTQAEGNARAGTGFWPTWTITPWAALIEALEAYYPKSGRRGRPPIALERLLTSSPVHPEWGQLARDLAGWFLVWLSFASYQSERAWLLLCIAGSLAVGRGLCMLSPPWIHRYVGLSGMEYGLFGAAATLEWRRTRWLSAVMQILVWAIVLCGVLIGPLPGEGFGPGDDVIPQAHLYGLTCGMGFALVHHAHARIRT